MTDLDIYIFLVIPGGMLMVLGASELWQRYENKNIQKHVDRLAEIRSTFCTLPCGDKTKCTIPCGNRRA